MSDKPIYVVRFINSEAIIGYLVESDSESCTIEKPVYLYMDESEQETAKVEFHVAAWLSTSLLDTQTIVLKESQIMYKLPLTVKRTNEMKKYMDEAYAEPAGTDPEQPSKEAMDMVNDFIRKLQKGE